MRIFWSKPDVEPVGFVYLTGSPARASEIRRAAGPACEMRAVSDSIDAAVRVATDTGSRVVLTEVDLPDGTWRDVIAACQKRVPSLAVVVILDHFEGAQWVEMIRACAYDIVLRPLGSEPLQSALARASRSSGLDRTVDRPGHLQ